MQKIFIRNVRIPLIYNGSSDNHDFIVHIFFVIRFFLSHLKTVYFSSTISSNVTAFQRGQIWVFPSCKLCSHSSQSCFSSTQNICYDSCCSYLHVMNQSSSVFTHAFFLRSSIFKMAMSVFTLKHLKPEYT